MGVLVSDPRSRMCRILSSVSLWNALAASFSKPHPLQVNSDPVGFDSRQPSVGAAHTPGGGSRGRSPDMPDAINEVPAFLSGGGEMGALMRSHDWSATPFGPIESWPQSLRAMVGACLNSPLLGTVLWGPELRMLYNDAYVCSMADRHPNALGQPEAVRRLFAELLEAAQDLMAQDDGVLRELHLFMKPSVIRPAHPRHLHPHEAVVLADFGQRELPEAHPLLALHDR